MKRLLSHEEARAIRQSSELFAGTDEARAIANAEQQGEDLTQAMRQPKADISRKAGEMERDSPLFYGTGANPTLFTDPLPAMLFSPEEELDELADLAEQEPCTASTGECRCPACWQTGELTREEQIRADRQNCPGCQAGGLHSCNGGWGPSFPVLTPAEWEEERSRKVDDILPLYGD